MAAPNIQSRKQRPHGRGVQRQGSIACLESAFALDRAGHEAAAVPLYKRAIKLGLQGNKFRDALVCLGSSLRTTGRPADAVRYLRLAKRRFPNDPVVDLFLALAYHGAGEFTQALRVAGLACLREARSDGVAAYRKILHRKYRSLRRAETHVTAEL